MQRVRILALKEDQASLIALLHQLGAIQLEQADKGFFFRDAVPPDYATSVSDEIFRLEGLVAALPPVPVSGTLEVKDAKNVLAQAREIQIDDQVKNLKVELESIDVTVNRNNTFLENLQKIRGFNKDLDVLASHSLSVALYSIPADDFNDFVQKLRATSKDCAIKEYTSSKKEVAALVAFPKTDQENAKTILDEFKTVKLDLPTDLGTAEQAEKKLQEENSELLSRKNIVEGQLLEISKKYYATIVALKEALNIEAQQIDAFGRGGQSEKTFVVEGWVPVTRLPELESKVDSLSNGKAVIEKISSKEEAPTLLKNSPRINYFEFFVRFFSLPKSEEIDPTWSIAIVFPIFFGMMLGDVGYGIVILLIGYWFARIGTNKSSARWLPASIRRFGKNLIPKRALGQLGRILIPSAIVGIIVGILTNAYFGFRLPSYAPLFDLIKTPQFYLIITLFVGLAHITIGYVYGIFIGLRTGHRRHAYSKIAWLGFMWSGVAAVWGALTFVLPVTAIPKFAEFAIIGVFLAFGIVGAISEGPGRFLLEIPTLMSHVISYGRILGVLLASLLLGYIAATSINLSSPISSLVVAIIVLILVTLLNVVLGIFEPAIQGIRLHYVEFYSKFFEGNGRRFSPFAERRQLTKKAST